LADTDLHTLLQDCLVLFADRITLQGVVVRTELAERFPVLRLDGLQMKQAIMNLVANALEAMPQGGTLTLATSMVEQEAGRSAGAAAGPAAADDRGAARPAAAQWATLSIGDTGGGIPREIVDEVFKPFFTTKEVGTGLGLTLVRRIARAHQGRVEVRNDPGKGVTFCLWLPVNSS
jgi:signal transduction histidine kinase